MGVDQEIHDTLKGAETSFRKYLETSTKLDWKLKKFQDKTEHGETLVTWESDKGTLTLVASSISEKVVDIRLHYNHANGDPEQPKVGRVPVGKIGDPKAVLGNLLGKYKGKVDWKGASMAERVAARFKGIGA